MDAAKLNYGQEAVFSALEGIVLCNCRLEPIILGRPINECFGLIRPLIEFSGEQIMQRTNNVFVFQVKFLTYDIDHCTVIQWSMKKYTVKVNECNIQCMFGFLIIYCAEYHNICMGFKS